MQNIQFKSNFFAYFVKGETRKRKIEYYKCFKWKKLNTLNVLSGTKKSF